MPRDRGSPLSQFAHALADGDRLRLGSPWLSDNGSVAVLPILAAKPQPRRCVLAIEVSDQVCAVDSGRIDWLTVRNDSTMAVFLPPGSLFRGQDTASRATTAGAVIRPQSEASVEVKCVHPSRPLVPGASLALDPHLAPDAVTRALVSRDQGRVWAAVAEFADHPGGSDDLTAVLPRPDAAQEPPEIPFEPGQCGIIILEAEGIAALEWFDSPESWKAVAGSAIRRHDACLRSSVRPPWVVALDPTLAAGAAKEFILQLAQRPFHPAAPSSWIDEDGILAYTARDGAILHIWAFVPDGSLEASETAASAESPEVRGMSESGASEAGDGEAAAVDLVADAGLDDSAPIPPATRQRRRKVLTSGWDETTFRAVDRYATKEFRGDRSAAMRHLVRNGLLSRGYLGPVPTHRPAEATRALLEAETPPPAAEAARAGLETRIQDFERIAETPEYATWLRKRARLELERMATTLDDGLVRSLAEAAVGRLSPVEPEPEPEPYGPSGEAVVSPPPPPVDVRPLLRQAFAASAGGDYREAIALFDRILAADPVNRTARLGRAVAYRRAGKSQEALDDLDAVLANEPRNAAALLARGQILQARGDLDGALAAFDLLVDVAASDWDVWMARGDVLAKMGRHDGALRSYSEALRRKPDDAGLQARIRSVETARTSAPPTTLPRPSVPAGVEEGQSYLVKEARRERSLSLFRALAGQRAPSLILTGRSRDVVRREVGVASARIIGLSFSPGEDLHNPTALSSLVHTVERFVFDNQGLGIILLDGLHDLVVNNGFRDTALTIERIHEVILQSRAILIVSVAPDDLADREAALLERSLRVLP